MTRNTRTLAASVALAVLAALSATAGAVIATHHAHPAVRAGDNHYPR